MRGRAHLAGMTKRATQRPGEFRKPAYWDDSPAPPPAPPKADDPAALSFMAYDPPSTLVVPQHPVARAKYPFIDVHNHQFELDDDGAFGPVELAHGGHYEYALTSPDSPIVHHIYVQPYLRSSRHVRLLSGDAESATRVNTNMSDDHVALIAMRMREWYATDRDDVPGDQRDVLEITSVAGTIDVAAAIIAESTLSFLGLGFPPDVPTWGRILYDGRDYMDVAMHWSLFPGIAIFLTVLSINFVGDGLQDALNPRKVL